MLLAPGLAFADVPVATITGPVTVNEPAASSSPTAETANAVYTVTLTGGKGSTDLVFDYTVTGTAKSGTDYTDAGNGKMTIAVLDGTTAASGSITIEVKGDVSGPNVPEAAETMVVTLTKVATTAGRVVIGTPNAVTTTIRENTRILSVTPPESATAEGQDASFRVSLADNDTNPKGLTIRYDVVPGTATAGDYLAPSGVLTIDSNQTNGTIVVGTKNDTVSEDAETFSVRLSSQGLPNDVGLGNASATATISASDDLSVSVTRQQVTVVEGSDAAFVVALTSAGSAASGQDVVVRYRTETGADKATADDDYEAPSGTLTIADGSSAGTIAIPTKTDDLRENEELTVTLVGVDTSAGTAALDSDAGDRTATVTIADAKGTVLVSVEDTTVTEGGSAEFTVKLSGKVDVEVGWATTAGTATSDTDYTDASGQTLTIKDGKTSGTLTVETTTDTVLEDDETFTVTLTLSDQTAGVALGDDKAQATITDDDSLTAEVTGPARVWEGEAAKYPVTLTPAGVTLQGEDKVVVKYQVGGSATPDTDYTAPVGTLTISNPAATTNVITIQTKADQQRGETLRLTLTDATADVGQVGVGPKSEVTTTMEAEGAVVVSVADAVVAENGTAAFGVSLRLASGSTLAEAVKLRYQTADGSATSPADYASTSGTLTIAAGKGATYSGNVSVNVVDDTLTEGAERFTLKLSLVAPVPPGVVLEETTAQGTIRGAVAVTAADDPLRAQQIASDPLTATVSAEKTNVNEGTDANFPVTLTGGTSTADVVVRYMVAGTATKALDYTAPSGTLTLATGTGSATIVIPTKKDDLLEADETLVVTLLDTTATAVGVVTATTTPVEATIKDAPGTVTASVAGATVTEGGKALFVVTLSGKVGQDVTVNYETPAPTEGVTKATRGTDYTGAPDNAALTIKAGVTTGTITVATTDDTADRKTEDNETFTVRLTSASPSSLVKLGVATATGTITDDDPLTVIVEGPDKVVSEGTTGSYTARLKGGTSNVAITVSYTKAGGNEETKTISAGSTTADLDTAAAGTSGSVVVRLTDVSTTAGSVRLGSPSSKSTTIVASGTPIVSISSPASSVTEGSDAEFPVSGLADGFTLRYQVVAGSATSADYGTTSGTITSGNITVSTKNDTLAEGAETFSVRLTGVTRTGAGTTPVIGTATATATIGASDPLSTTIRALDTTVVEGDSATFEVTLTGGTSSKSVAIDYTVAAETDGDVDDAEAEDYTPQSGTLTIGAGKSKGTISIKTVDDGVLEPEEDFEVTLGTGNPADLFADGQPSGSASTKIDASGRTVTASVAGATVTEGGKALFVVTLSGKVGQDVTVNYETPAPTEGVTKATRGTDYTGAPDNAALTIKAGVTTGTITVATTDDTADRKTEDNETFTVRLTSASPSSLVKLGVATATGTITDDDPLTVIVEGPDKVVSEGTTGSYTARLKGGTSNVAITVSYTKAGGNEETKTISAGSTTADLDTAAAGTSGSVVVRLTDVSTTAGSVRLGSPSSKSTTIVASGTPIVSISSPASSVTEGSDAEFPVSGLADGFTLRYQVVAGSATSADYGTTSGTITSGNITVSTENDTLAEGAETFSVRLTGVTRTGAGTTPVIGTATATATIGASDPLSTTIRALDTTVVEGDSATFEVTLTGGTSSKSVAIDYTVAAETDGDVDDAEAEDYTPQSGTLTIGAGKSKGTISIKTVDDGVLEPEEDFEVTLGTGNPADLFADGQPSGSASTKIGTSDGPVTVSVADVTVNEGESAVFTVQLTGKVHSSVDVNYSISTNTTESTTLAKSASDCDNRAATEDYCATGTSPLTIAAGKTAGTITVRTYDDKLAEESETFTVTLSSVTPLGGLSLGRSTATATINDDALTVNVKGPASVNEGDAAVFTVTRTGGTGEEAVTVNYTVGGTASAADYTAPGGSLVIPKGVGTMTGTITIRTTEDTLVDLRETIEVTLTAAKTAGGEEVKLGTDKVTTIIVDDDGPVQVSLEADDEVVVEGEAAGFTVTLSGTVANQDLTFRYATTARTATAGADYTTAAGTVTVPAGESSATFTVQTIDDNTNEDADEAFTVTLTGVNLPDDVQLASAARQVTATITDFRLIASVAGPETVQEGSTARFIVDLTGGDNRRGVVVDYTVSGRNDATADDYTPSGTAKLTFSAPVLTRTISIQVVDDDVLDRGESLVVTLTDVTPTVGAAVLGARKEAVTRIVDPGRVEVTVDNPTVDEGDAARFTVMLKSKSGKSGKVAKDVTLDYATGAAVDTATAGADYTAAAATVTVPAGQTTATFEVTTVEDALNEANERFTVTLTGSADLDLLGVTAPTGPATATITDDDPLEASVTVPSTVNEGAPAVFTVVLTGATADTRSSVAVEVDYEVGGTADAGEDYDDTELSGTLTIPAGEASGAISIPVLKDDVLDHGDTLSVTLTDDPRSAGTVSLGAPSTAATEITDDTEVSVTVTAAPVTEGDNAIFTVALDGKVADDVTVGYVTEEGSAKQAVDYEHVRGSVTVSALKLEAEFTVRTEEDEVPEVPETFTVVLTPRKLPAGVTLSVTEVMATITDDDPLTAKVTDASVPEGEPAILTVTLSHVVEWPVSVQYATADGTGVARAVAGEDYDAAPDDAAVAIAAGADSARLTVVTRKDTLAEHDETFTVTPTGLVLPDGVELAEPDAEDAEDAATVTILDDDELTVSVKGPAEVVEGKAATYTVSLEGGTGSEDVEVSYSTKDSTATADKDFKKPSGGLVILAGDTEGTITIQTMADKVVDPNETLVVKLLEDGTTTAAGSVVVGRTSSTATTMIVDPVYESINRVNEAVLPEIARAAAASTLDAVGRRMERGAAGPAPAAAADLAGLTGFYRALQANERALQDGSYDLARVLSGSSFLVPLSAHEDGSDPGIGFAFWGGGDYRGISGGDPDEADVEWSGSAWSARLGADARFVDSLLTGLALSWNASALEYEDDTGGADRSGTHGTSLISVHPYVGWTTPDFGVWATGGLGWGEVTIDDDEAEVDAQSTGLSQWSLGAGASVTVLAIDDLIAGGTTALKLRGEGLLAHATVEKADTVAGLEVDVNQVRAVVEASHAQRLGSATLTPVLELGGRLDGGDGETGAGFEVGGGVSYADAGFTVESRGRVLLFRDNFGEWGLSGLVQYDPGAPAHGLMVSVRPAFGATASGVAGLWEHGTLDLLGSAEQAGGRVEAEIGYGVPVFGAAGVLTPFAGASLTDAGGNSLSLGSRLLVAPLFEVSLEALRSESAAGATPEHGLTLEGAIRW